MAHQDEEHSHSEDHHSHHDSADHAATTHSEEHHSDHHGHWQPPHFTPEERILWGYPKGIQNSCTDNHVAFEMCTRKTAEGGFPFRWTFKLHWADRVQCQNEWTSLVHCEENRVFEVFERTKGSIINLKGK
ncbi:unnamed protein product [Blepharisma stoltei]|uniref:Uncharacterized protein n=1 Tax=Blepharisma stoltei TaxID=1481888 RepID=A0AAU9JSY0_9CILI|nr:unnamed protein product [Blepharisma stoltei]